MVSVHEVGCRDQIAPCAKFKYPSKMSSKMTSRYGTGGSNAPSHSLKERRITTPVGTTGSSVSMGGRSHMSLGGILGTHGYYPGSQGSLTGDYDYDDVSHLARGRISSGGQISLYSASSESLDDF